MRLLFLLYLIAIIPVSPFKDCNFTQFDFLSQYSLGQQDQLNHTFEGVNKRMQVLPDIEFKNNISQTYRISNTQTLFKYLDGKQTAQVIYDDIIYIKGGISETYLNFSWSKDQQKGVGNAFCLTDPITFAKLLYLNNAFMSYKLADFQNISYYQSSCHITRVDPVLEPTDIVVLQSLINDNQGNNIKNLVVKEIMKYYEQELNSSLYDDRQPINNHSQYTWIDPISQKPKITINYTLLPTGAHLSQKGLALNFITQITDDDEWKCGATVPLMPKNLSVYGGIQQYLSLSIFENSVRFAYEKGVFNSQLNQQNWQSRVFQFFAGDLYQVIPILAHKYYASTPIIGSCNNIDISEVTATIISNDTITMALPFECELKVSNTKISSFQTLLTSYIQIEPQSDSLVFKIVKATHSTQFKSVGEYQIHDLQLASLFISRSLERLYEGQVFGSGWKTYSRDYAKILLQDGCLFIYDAASRI